MCVPSVGKRVMPACLTRLDPSTGFHQGSAQRKVKEKFSCQVCVPKIRLRLNYLTSF